MGWQDRDYAKLDDVELRRLYHVRRASSRLPSGEWLGVILGCIVVAAAGFVWTHRHPHHPLYGTVVRSGPHAGAVCTELELVTATSWRCDAYVSNLTHAAVHTPAPFRGPCSRLKVEGQAWVCLAALVGSNT